YRGNVSPTANKSGPTLLLLPSTEWHLAHAARFSSLNNSRPRPAWPSFFRAKSRYSRNGGAGSVGRFWDSASHDETMRAKAKQILEPALMYTWNYSGQQG